MIQGFPTMHCAVPRLCIRRVPWGWKKLLDLFLVPRVSCNHFRPSITVQTQSTSPFPTTTPQSAITSQCHSLKSVWKVKNTSHLSLSAKSSTHEVVRCITYWSTKQVTLKECCMWIAVVHLQKNSASACLSGSNGFPGWGWLYLFKQFF